MSLTENKILQPHVVLGKHLLRFRPKANICCQKEANGMTLTGMQSNNRFCRSFFIPQRKSRNLWVDSHIWSFGYCCASAYHQILLRYVKFACNVESITIGPSLTVASMAKVRQSLSTKVFFF